MSVRYNPKFLPSAPRRARPIAPFRPARRVPRLAPFRTPPRVRLPIHPVLSFALDLIEDQMRLPAPVPRQPPGTYWRLCCGPTPTWRGYAYYLYQSVGAPACSICGLTGQALPVTGYWGSSPWPESSPRGVFMLSRPQPLEGTGHYRVHAAWELLNPPADVLNPAGVPALFRNTILPEAVLNPNWLREQPGNLPVVPRPVSPPAFNPNDAFEVYNGLLPKAPPRLSSGDPVPWIAAVSPPPPPGQKPPRPFLPRPAGRRPPGRKEKQRKIMSRAQRISLAIVRAIDNISEKAEIIDAFFRALPEETQRRWSKGRKSRGPIDQFGQYGIDGADWKLQALWHNWHKVDMAKAVKNVAKNALEDQLIGAYQKRIPASMSFAVGEFLKEVGIEPEKFVSQKVDQIFGD